MRRSLVLPLLLAALAACQDSVVAPAAPDEAVLARQARTNCQGRCAVTLDGWLNAANGVRALNERGEILGMDPAMRWVVQGRSGRRTLQPYPSGYDGTTARDLNDRGEVAGNGYRLQGAESGYSAVLWTAAGTLRDLGSFGARDALVSAMNDHGDLVGRLRYDDGSSRPFLWSRGKLTLIPLPAGASGEPVDVNKHGQVAGTWYSAQGARAFVWDRKAGFRDLSDLGGGAGGRAVHAAAINDHGWVVGSEGQPGGRGVVSVQTPFLWTPAGGMRSLGSLGGQIARATDVNARGEVVGEGQTAGGAFRAFVWSETEGMRVLDASGDESLAMAINDRGDVLGNVFTRGTGWKATVWTRDPAAFSTVR
ncbi:MAG TPA: hypothetical protein VK689_17385 [Armatimonadota bacterium]|nr:hypothetical protein [Armatimonadota bacterium]